MDFSTLNTIKGGEDGATYHLVGPRGELLVGDDDKPVTMTVKGSDSATWDKHVQRTNRTNKMKISGGGVDIDPTRLKEIMIDRMAECVMSWDGIDYEGEAPYPCTRANAVTLFENLPWLREGVLEFMGERANFLGKA